MRQAWAAEIAGLAPLAIQHAKRVPQRRTNPSKRRRRSRRSSSTRRGASQDVIEAQVARVGSGRRNSRGGLIGCWAGALRRPAGGQFSLATGGWVLRRAAWCSAGRAGRSTVRHSCGSRAFHRSFRDGVFVNQEPASQFSIDRE